MSMIDHDEQDRLRAQSRTNADSLRYRHIGSGAIYRVHSQARSPDGPICLVAADAPRGAMWTMQVSAAELARTFVRCDGAHAAPSADAATIPTPQSLTAAAVVADTAAVNALSARVAEALRREWTPDAARVSVALTINDAPRVVRAVSAKLGVAGWQATESDDQRQGRYLVICPAPAPDFPAR